MGGIEINQTCETGIKGLFSVGECSSVELHGANRLGSNSLTELVVFGQVSCEHAARWALESSPANSSVLDSQGRDVETRFRNLMKQEGNKNWSKIRDEMGL